MLAAVPEPVRLNLGCGRNNIAGMINVDLGRAGHVPDVELDLEADIIWPWPESSVAYAQMIHVLEHIHDPLALMARLHYVMEPDGIVYIQCPHGASDDAWEDPTHVRPYFPGSFRYFGQPIYWRADYGYRGDFEVEKCEIVAAVPDVTADATLLLRNQVGELRVTMRTIKPIREHARETSP